MPFFALRKLLLQNVFGHYPVSTAKCPLYNRVELEQYSTALHASQFILLLISAAESSSSTNSSKLVPLAAIHAHAITLTPPCLTDDVCFGSWVVFPLHYPFPIILVQVHFSCLLWFPTLSGVAQLAPVFLLVTDYWFGSCLFWFIFYLKSIVVCWSTEAKLQKTKHTNKMCHCPNTYGPKYMCKSLIIRLHM